ncbi:MAG: multiheme c-type cytochrome [Myxococcota bacterium]
MRIRAFCAFVLLATACDDSVSEDNPILCDNGSSPVCAEELACEDGSAPSCASEDACSDGSQPVCMDEAGLGLTRPHGDAGLLEARTAAPRTSKEMPIPPVVMNAPAESGSPGGQCLTCHEGIEEIGADSMDAHGDLGCVVCHNGNKFTELKAEAHQGLLPNPGDMTYALDDDPATQVCGGCHGDDDQTHNSHVTRMRKSLHATSAGIISGTRYSWGKEDKGDIRYATYSVEDLDGDIGGLASLEQVPKETDPDGSEADDYLRNQCLRCHVYVPGKTRTGDYRGSGCTSCHVLYTNDATTATGDPTVPKDTPGHMLKHVITSKIPSQQCIHCHNRGGRTGPSYIGTIESDGYGSPWTGTGGKQGQRHGKNYNHLNPDLHWEAGMECIDCHGSDDLHGDGNIYGKKEEATFIECESCHGSTTEPAPLADTRGVPLPNVERDSSGVITLTSKYDGTQHPVTEAMHVNVPAMRIPAHQEKLECYACHATWAPQCYGCHARQDISRDGGDNLAAIDPSSTGTVGAWSETRSYVRWEDPALGINSEGKVSPFIPGCQVVFSKHDGDTPISSNITHTTTDGFSGISMNQIQPHTTQRRARDCASCHNNPKALGIGSGEYRIADNFPPEPEGNSKASNEVYAGHLQFELEQMVSPEGVQLQGNAHPGARPFNLTELHRISKQGTCESCHRDPSITSGGGASSSLE